MPNSHPLLAPLTSQQQRVVDLLADAFLAENCQWPFFAWLQAQLDDDDLDAVAVLLSFPTIGTWNYGAVAWNHNDAPEAEVALTVVGMSHSATLRGYVPVFFRFVDYLAARRKLDKPKPREVGQLTITSQEFDDFWRSGRHLRLPPRLTAQLKAHEPPLRYGGGSFSGDGSWTMTVGRQLFPFVALDSITEYVARLEELIGPAPALPPIFPSPISLAAALDYLDSVWRLTHKRKRLFSFTSAEGTTRLAFDVQTAEEFAAHLSSFADILREANSTLPSPTGKKPRDRPLARIEADLNAKLDLSAAARASEAIRTLELVIALRDADQHGAASPRAIRAFKDLRVGYPPPSWQVAWQNISTQAINAVNTIREELNAIS